MRFVFGFMERPRIGIGICFSLHGITENRNRDSLSASWKDRELESRFIFGFIGYWRREIRIYEGYDRWPMQTNRKSGRDSPKHGDRQMKFRRITAECRR